MKLGLNSVLFGKHDMDTAFKWTKVCGYDAIEISAIDGMSQHLVLARWRELVAPIKELVKKYELPVQAMEQPKQDPKIMEEACRAAVEIGIPVINCGPGGKSDDEASLQQTIDSLGKLSDMAQRYGVTLCVKAHVGAAMYNTPTTLRVLNAITSPA
ncbi:MAG: TIM barrel protein, partial [Candidatus Sumerlaeota bacterium]|nr:TIM barrel protein [Candidatus Sumerlaeota bacterium]